MATLLAGAVFRGEFEARIEAVIREAEADPNIILFMDEFHTIMTPSGGLDAANMLKPALTRGKMRLIGATTTQDYERFLARDEAISRRFEVLWVEEPTRDETLAILSGVKSGLEAHYRLQIDQDAIKAAVDLAIRYLPDRKLPDKALDLLDQACAQKALQSISIKPAGAGKTYMMQTKAGTVGREEIARTISKRCRIPYELLAQSDQERLRKLEPYLSQRIIGQEKAIRQISDALQVVYKGLKNPQRPIASFLFAGPTGVGKTAAAKALSEFLFGSPDSLIRIDLSEYRERHQVARLLGAPPGYVGYEEPGILTAALRKRPASGVIFDEIEKAHPDVLNVLLQILDEGELTDGQGRKASFREAIVILTSNLVVETKPIGFNVETAQQEKPAFVEALRQYVRPELIGRIGQIILFEPLSRDALLTITDQLLNSFKKQLQDQGQMADLPADIRKRIIAKIPELRFGARELEQLVKSEITAWMLCRDETPISAV
jgi:ATP-dependent Clp protease ATP-binding subunit ClpC